MNWRSVKLGDACDVIAGGTPKRSEPNYWGGSIPWVKISDMLQGRIIKTDEAITRAGLERSTAKLLPPGTILVSIFATIGRTAVLDCEAATNQAIVGVIPKNPDQFDDRFLEYALKGKTAELMRKARGVAQVNINSSVLKETDLPLPPLPEQKRIAAVLDAADALRAKRRESIEQLDKLLQSTFLEMFGDPVTNPKGWPVCSLPELSKKFTDGPFGSNLKSSHYVEDGVRVIRLQNIGVGKMLDDDLAFITEEHYESLPRNHCQPGDVIIGTLGDPNLRACVLPNYLKRALNKADCLMLRPDLEKATPQYLCWLLNCPATVQKASALVRGQTRGRISSGRLKELEIPSPPRDLQHKFAAIVASIEKQKDRMHSHLIELDKLVASLQSRAFQGEL